MEYYLNEIYLGRGCYGVKTAAAEYFGKELQSLTPAECASLISITNNPSIFNPYSQSVYKYKGEERNGAQRNRYRQLNVLSEMYNQGYLTKEEYEEAVAQEMVFKSGIANEDRWTICENAECGYEGTRNNFTGDESGWYCPICGSLTSVNTNASQHIYSWFVDAVIIDFASYLAEQDGKSWDEMVETERNIYLDKIQKGGYHIYTTLDMEVQDQVDVIYSDVKNVPKKWNGTQQLQSAIVVIDNSTGDVVALSGGVGEKNTFLGYHRATQAKLQTGSAQKPISVYAPAFEKGVINPATVLKDLPVMYEGNDGWPNNDHKHYNYARTVYQGIVSSINTISVRTLDLSGHEYAYSFAKYNFGQKHLIEYYPTDWEDKSDIGRAPLALGALTLGSTVREMSAAYATFANNGTWREPRLYTKVYNSDGELVVDNTQDNRQILSEKAVNYMNYCLYNAANHGTGGGASFGGQPIAGKTGTTSSNKDRWFCGFTGHYTAAVWCGYDKPEQIRLYDGSNPAAVLWRKVMQPIHNGLERVALYDGTNFRSVTVCLDSGKIATAACGEDVRGIERTSSAYCYREDIPGGVCDKHVMIDYCVTGGGVATEYCSQFAGNQIGVASLVKMNDTEIQEIRDAASVGLADAHLMDSYVYYEGEGGWHGFRGTALSTNELPYVPCQVHTHQSWIDMNMGGDQDGGYGDNGYYGENGDHVIVVG